MKAILAIPGAPSVFCQARIPPQPPSTTYISIHVYKDIYVPIHVHIYERTRPSMCRAYIAAAAPRRRHKLLGMLFPW